MKVDDEHFTILVSPGEGGLAIAACVELPSCVGEGRTVDEALANVSELIGLSLGKGAVPFRAVTSAYIHVRRASDGTMSKLTRAEWLARTTKPQ